LKVKLSGFDALEARKTVTLAIGRSGRVTWSAGLAQWKHGGFEGDEKRLCRRYSGVRTRVVVLGEAPALLARVRLRG
jgi:hypothetical protein